MNQFFCYFFLNLLLANQLILADIIGNNDELEFKASQAGEVKMTLNSTGLGIGLSPNSSLHVQGSLAYNYQNISSNTILTGNSFIFVDSSSDNITLTLPYSGNVDGRLYRIKKIHADNHLLIRDEEDSSFKDHLFLSSSPAEELPFAEFISASNTWHLLERNGVSERWDPSISSNVVLWYDASDVTSITSLSDNVTQWNDKSGNDFHVTQTLGNRHPRTGTRTMNNLNVLDFDGTQDYLRYAGDVISSGQSYTKIIAYFIDNTGFNNNTLSVGNSAFYNELSQYHGGGQYSSSSYPGINTPMSAATRYEVGVQGDIFINGSNVGSNGGLGVWSNDGNFVQVGSFSNANFLDGVLGEVILLDYAVDVETRQKIEGYMAWKWGLRNYLPSIHPYKSTPPTK